MPERPDVAALATELSQRTVDNAVWTDVAKRFGQTIIDAKQVTLSTHTEDLPERDVHLDILDALFRDLVYEWRFAEAFALFDDIDFQTQLVDINLLNSLFGDNLIVLAALGEYDTMIELMDANLDMHPENTGMYMRLVHIFAGIQTYTGLDVQEHLDSTREAALRENPGMRDKIDRFVRRPRTPFLLDLRQSSKRAPTTFKTLDTFRNRGMKSAYVEAKTLLERYFPRNNYDFASFEAPVVSADERLRIEHIRQYPLLLLEECISERPRITPERACDWMRSICHEIWLEDAIRVAEFFDNEFPEEVDTLQVWTAIFKRAFKAREPHSAELAFAKISEERARVQARTFAVFESSMRQLRGEQDAPPAGRMTNISTGVYMSERLSGLLDLRNPADFCVKSVMRQIDTGNLEGAIEALGRASRELDLTPERFVGLVRKVADFAVRLAQPERLNDIADIVETTRVRRPLIDDLRRRSGGMPAVTASHRTGEVVVVNRPVPASKPSPASQTETTKRGFGSLAEALARLGGEAEKPK